MKKLLLAVLGLVAFAAVGMAITVNPASNVTADSDDSPNNLVLRDAGGLTGISSTAKTLAQLQLLPPARVGQILFCSNCTNLLGATGELVVGTGTSAGNWASAGGDQFK